MKRIYYIIYLMSVLLQTGCAENRSTVKIENIRCEYLKQPLGIDLTHPRFSWELTSGESGKRQQAYQILVATEKLMLNTDNADAWDSGKVGKNTTNQIVYQGQPLRPHTFYYWKVRIWDEKGNLSEWSPVSSFSVGPLAGSDWKAQWIGEPEIAIEPDNIYYPHWGYRSDFSENETTIKWIRIDLSKEESIDALKLHPLKSQENLFPLRFKIEIDSDTAFHTARALADETSQDINLTLKDSYYRKLSVPVTGRYVKITVSKLPASENNRYEYGLSEIELFANGQNIALNKSVTASEDIKELTWGSCKWTPELLTDGYYEPNHNSLKPVPIPPSPIFRKEINIGKKIKNALYYTSAQGVYEAYVNGEKVGRQILAPEWTDYDNHIQYQTHEVSSMLKEGTNVLGAMLADGWYAGALFSYPVRGGYGFTRKFIAQLVINYDDGTSATFGTDESWKYKKEGPVTHASIFDGETFDARKHEEGWNKTGFDDTGWDKASLYAATAANLCAQMNEPITVIKEMKPVSIRKIGNDKYIFDLGQNMVGWCHLSLPYNPAKTITLRYAEILDEENQLYIENLRTARQTDVYIPDNEKQINYEPKFTYHGFRYVEIEGLTQPPQLECLTGKMIASSSPLVGTFECADKDINQLWSNILWTQWNNMISVPTDCPQRDERSGWTGDAQVFAQNAIYNLDMAAFYTKWIRDVSDSQLEDGRYPDIAPHVGEWESHFNSPGWADAGVIIPWRVYQNYNDVTLLSRQYESMKKFVDFVHLRNPGLIWTNAKGNMYGDWLNGNTIISDDYPKTGGGVPNEVFATAYFAYSTELLSKMAGLLGKSSDNEFYQKLASSIRSKFLDEFVNEDGIISGNTQAGYALALELDILPEHLRKKAAAHMVEALKVYDNRMSTGIHTTIRLMNQLSEYGYTDLAYELLMSRRFPSWLYSVDQGATTIWERWDGYVKGRGFQNPGMNSFNHVAIGAVGEWMYKHMLGIQYDENQPGYRHFYIKPQPGKILKWVKGSYHSINGVIAVSWENKDNLLNLEVTIPVNTEATVVLPFADEKKVEIQNGIKPLRKDGNMIRLASGTYRLVVHK